MLLRLMARVDVLCSSADVVGGRNARDAQNNQREVEAHDEPVVAVDTRHQRGRKTAQRDQLKQVLRCNRDIGNFARDCRAGGDGNAGVRLGERGGNRSRRRRS